MQDLCVSTAEDLADELELIEMELHVLLRRLRDKDIYWNLRAERVIREQRAREVVEVDCSRVCRM